MSRVIVHDQMLGLKVLQERLHYLPGHPTSRDDIQSMAAS